MVDVQRIEPGPGQESVWDYPRPPAIEATTRHLRVDACWVDEERVQANEGAFYGGWITSDVVGPFKGGPGSAGW
jgi:hypothetical protein